MEVGEAGVESQRRRQDPETVGSDDPGPVGLSCLEEGLAERFAIGVQVVGAESGGDDHHRFRPPLAQSLHQARNGGGGGSKDGELRCLGQLVHRRNALDAEDDFALGVDEGKGRPEAAGQEILCDDVPDRPLAIAGAHQGYRSRAEERL